MNYMRGDCYGFAVGLHRAGWTAYVAEVPGEGVHHAFAKKGGRYIDARGEFSSFSELTRGMRKRERAVEREMTEEELRAYAHRYTGSEWRQISRDVKRLLGRFARRNGYSPLANAWGAEPQAEDILASGICGEDEFFHACPTRVVRSILREGLRPGRGENWPGHLTDWSFGRMFLAAGFETAMLWKDFLEEQLHEPTSILQLHLTPVQIARLQVDEKSLHEGTQCSFYLRETIPAHQITVEVEDNVLSVESAGDY